MISRFFFVSLMAAIPANLCDDRKSLRLSCLKKLLDTGKTLCDISAGNTAGMEGTHGQLCTRLTDRLCCDDTDSLTDLYSLAGCHVGAIALCTDTDVGTAGQDGTDLDLSQRFPFSSTPSFMIRAARFGVIM